MGTILPDLKSLKCTHEIFLTKSADEASLFHDFRIVTALGILTWSQKNISCNIKFVYIMILNFRVSFISLTCHFSKLFQQSLKSNLRGHNWVHFAHRLYSTVTMNSNFAILKTWNCFQLE